MGQLRLWIALGAGLLATLLWESGALSPLRLLIVLVHELWHGFAALLSGALLQSIRVGFDEGGETFVTGLSSTSGFVFTVSAGYLGAAFTGGLLLNRGLVGRWERVTLVAFGLSLAYMSFLFTEIGGAAFYTGIGWGLGLMVVALLGQIPARLALLIVGSVAMWYCLYDLLDFTREIERTDAGIFAAYLKSRGWTGWTLVDLARLISLLWSAMTLLILGLTLKPALFPAHVAVEEAPAPPPAQPAAFPGEVTPPVQEWLLANGFGLDGRPLPAELNDSPTPRPTPETSIPK